MAHDADNSTVGTRQLARYLAEQVSQEDWAGIVRALIREKLRLETERRRLDLDERQGRLVFRDAVEGEWREICSIIRCRLQALPGEIAASVPVDVRGLVLEEANAKVVNALKELAKHGEDAEVAAA